MKFFHWDKQCKQEIEALKSLYDTLRKNDDLWSQKHQVALKGITINEEIADKLRREVITLEAANKLLEQQVIYFINENKDLKNEKAVVQSVIARLEIKVKEFEDAHTFALSENLKLKKELESRSKKKKINETQQ